jgi:pimeloyl-ACP methyl ester carboxylesterase
MAAAFDEGHVTTIDGLRLFVRDYNAAPAGPTPVLCLPGLTRNHRDFGPIAEILASSRRVICPDMRGRGASDYDERSENYNPVMETGDALHLIDVMALPPVLVIGTSRGGISAMLMAAMKPQVLAGAVLNDVGPKLEKGGLLRLVATLSLAPDSFPSWDAAAASLKNANGRFFPTLSDDEWRAFAHRLHAEIDGKPARDYDWKLARATETAVSDEPPTLWPQFDALAQKPLLTIRGGLSDILSEDTLAEMRRRAPQMRAVTLPDRGHTPFLDEPECVEAIEALLEEIDSRCART